MTVTPEKWAAARKLRPSSGRECLHWVSKGRCGVSYCQAASHSRPWLDHVTGWITSKGGRLLVSQPYSLNDEDFASMVEACKEFDLEIHCGTGFYGYGTFCIFMAPKGQGTKEALE